MEAMVVCLSKKFIPIWKMEWHWMHVGMEWCWMVAWQLVKELQTSEFQLGIEPMTSIASVWCSNQLSDLAHQEFLEVSGYSILPALRRSWVRFLPGTLKSFYQGPVVRKLINANPGLNNNQGFNFRHPNHLHSHNLRISEKKSPIYNPKAKIL